MKKKVIVALSGGVDSSVSALLLKKQGYDIAAVFMKNWEEDDKNGTCSAKQDLSDAQQVADTLGIKLHRVNFASEYWHEVFMNFISEYKKGRTPNPDILCNEYIKFKLFLTYALSLGADKIATGHYAHISQNTQQYQLKTAVDSHKDQTYFLYRLNQYQLSKSLFPLGKFSKYRVRKIAKDNQLITATKKDSTGICFIGRKDFPHFLADYIKPRKGNIVDEHGRFIKHHQGIEFYTIGQRKGLGIGGGFGTSNKPWFVAAKNIASNELLVVQSDHPLLYSQQLHASQVHWISKSLQFPLNCLAKIRHRQPVQSCKVGYKKKQLIVNFDKSQRAITPGQSIVFYKNNTCLGGAIIDKCT